jgi:hypothetical protein
MRDGGRRAELRGTIAGVQLEAAIWICPTCGAHFAPSDAPPPACPICLDERQWVPADGQPWSTLQELARAGHRSVVRELEPGLLGIGAEPEIGVGQRGLLVLTPEGNVLWDPPVFIDDAAVQAVRRAGGLHAISSSHPHMYGAIAEWARHFDAQVILPHDDARWLMRPIEGVRRWSGALEIAAGVTLVQCGGHFPGSAILHWAAGAGGTGALLSGDTVFVTPGADRVTFAWSAPNRLPLSAPAVRRIVEVLRPYAFDRIYAGWWEPVLAQDAAGVLRRSADRYIQLLLGDPSSGAVVAPAPAG